MEENLFYGGPVPKNKDKSFYWVTTRLLRESGPWCAEVLSSPEDVYEIINKQFDLENCDREHFLAIHLNTKYRTNAISTVSIGTSNSTTVVPKETFKTAIISNSDVIILAHNHPSGDPTPSKDDIETTQRLVEAGKILGIHIVDHIIFGAGKYLSFKNKGLI